MVLLFLIVVYNRLPTRRKDGFTKSYRCPIFRQDKMLSLLLPSLSLLVICLLRCRNTTKKDPEKRSTTGSTVLCSTVYASAVIDRAPPSNGRQRLVVIRDMIVVFHHNFIWFHTGKKHCQLEQFAKFLFDFNRSHICEKLLAKVTCFVKGMKLVFLVIFDFLSTFDFVLSGLILFKQVFLLLAACIGRGTSTSLVVLLVLGLLLERGMIVYLLEWGRKLLLLFLIQTITSIQIGGMRIMERNRFPSISKIGPTKHLGRQPHGMVSI